jgi:hypothetical protein
MRMMTDSLANEQREKRKRNGDNDDMDVCLHNMLL